MARAPELHGVQPYDGDYGRVYWTAGDGWRPDGSPPLYVGVIWSPEAGGGKAKAVFRSRCHEDPEAAYQEMLEAAQQSPVPVEVWRHNHQRVGIVGGTAKAKPRARRA